MNMMHLISHVHWDPMWYSTYEEYRLRLLPLVKKLLHILESQENYCFMFDGQVSAIDDYLEIYPNDEKRIATLVGAGRLIIGPWYIQPEEFMISGECHIRNLMLGRERGKSLGGVANVSYLCDMVGHIAQMPQIIKGFGMDCFVGWRGILNGRDVNKSEFIWEGPDGSQVLMMVMPASYNGGLFPRTFSDFQVHVEQLRDKAAPYATTDSVLIMQGGDHLEPVEEIPELIGQYNRVAGCEAIQMTTLEKRARYIRENNTSLEKHKGEFRNDFLPDCFILTGILSTRMEVKLRNERVLTDLEKWVEPFSSAASLLGYTYPQEVLAYAWKKMVKVSFHDCIYGAHVDSVTPDIMSDYKKINEINGWLAGEALKVIADRIDTKDRPMNVTLFNPSGYPRKNEVTEFELFMPEDINVRQELAAFAENGAPLALQLLSFERIINYSDAAGHLKDGEGKGGILYKFLIGLNEIPALGFVNVELKRDVRQDGVTYQKLAKRAGARMNCGDVRAEADSCENGKLKVTFNPNGTMDILNKKTGRLYQQMHYFEDSGDAGDNYNFSAPINNTVYTSKSCLAEISLYDNSPLRAVYKIVLNLRLPFKVGEDSRRCDEQCDNWITSYVTLKSDSDAIEVKTIIENVAQDHRVKVVLPTGLEATDSYAGSQFCVVKRPLWKDSPEVYIEKRHGNYPHRFFVDISNGEEGVAFLDRGIPEYIATCDGKLALTLLRCTGYLSKNTLPERLYRNAGPMIKTPMAQQQGSFTFDYAIYFHLGTWEDGMTYQYAEQFNTPIRAVQGSEHEGVLPHAMSFIKMIGEGVALSAFKQAKNGNGYIIRLYNITSMPRDGGFTFFRSLKTASETDLNEDIIGNVDFQNERIMLTIGPHQIKTIYIEIND